MAHGGTNFGFFSGANTGANDSDYKADLTSYDYDAPIKESGDVENPKFEALRRVIQTCTGAPLHPSPSKAARARYGHVKVSKVASLFEVLDSLCGPKKVIVAEHPITMESVGQMYGFLLYVSHYQEKQSSSVLSISKVHDRAQVFVSCSLNATYPKYVGVIERWSGKELELPHLSCPSNVSLYILVENMGRVNYGPYIFDQKGILSTVDIDNIALSQWKMYPLSFNGVANLSKLILIKQIPDAKANEVVLDNLKNQCTELTSDPKGDNLQEPTFYEGKFRIDSSDEIKDTFISFRGWTKGVAFVNNFNIGRFWPAKGPQCNLYVPAPILKHGENILVIFELHNPNPELTIQLVEEPDFTCG